MLQKYLSDRQRQTVFIILLLMVPFLSPATALLAGLIVAFTIGNPFVAHNKIFTKVLLQASVVGLGFGMNLSEAMEAGKTGLVFTVFSITLTMVLGLVVGRWLKVNVGTRTLISGGTAICGGSAIAAIAPVINARDSDMTVALGTIFSLNALALFVFPPVGTLLGMTDTEFGYWCAIAIHDTSSVVGAAAERSAEALAVATTTKLIRALWIIPLSLVIAVVWNRRQGGNGDGKRRVAVPWFIFLYVIAMVIATYVPAGERLYGRAVEIARMGMVYTLFLIGSGLSWQSLKEVGVRPILLGVILWVVISVVAAVAIMFNV